MKHRQLSKQLAETEENLKKFAKQLALTSDCLNHAKDKEEEFITETKNYRRKIEYLTKQKDQELKDKQIIIDDLGHLHRVKEKLVMQGKSSYKSRVDRATTFFSDKDTQYFSGRDARMSKSVSVSKKVYLTVSLETTNVRQPAKTVA